MTVQSLQIKLYEQNGLLQTLHKKFKYLIHSLKQQIQFILHVYFC